MVEKMRYFDKKAGIPAFMLCLEHGLELSGSHAQ